MAKRVHPKPEDSQSQTRRGGARHWLRPLTRAWDQWRKGATATAAPVIEEYEQRLMYSADIAAVGLALTSGAASAPAVEQRVMDAHGEYSVNDVMARARQTELVIVDAAVEDRNSLLNQIDTNEGRRIELITLAAGADGIDQISAALAGRNDIAAVHILSHGTDGEIRLGSSTLNAVQLAARHDEITQWGVALAADADILLYGCDVAAGSAGEAFVQQLSQLTRADVAASNNLTGNAALGGDWTLEYAVGRIDSQLAVNAEGGAAWQGTLATFTVTNNANNGNGSLRKAIDDANAASGADNIVFNIGSGGVQTISILSPLTITDQVTIDGTQNNSATANGGLPAIIIDGGGLNGNGLTLADGSDGSTIRGLVIRDFKGNGIEIEAGANGNTLANNFIGDLAEDGTLSGGANVNTGAGIHINSLFNTVGGTAVTDRNVIAGNDGAGLLVENPNGSAVLGSNNLIQGNIIGTEIDGTTALGNGVGIEFRNAAQWDRVFGNRIAHNTGSGIVIGDTTGLTVQDLLIGGSAGNANTITLNGGDGVTVLSGIHNSILTNTITGNGGLGIDLRNTAAGVGVTANDGADADSGGNELQNFPILTSALVESPTEIRIIGKLVSVPGVRHEIEFFSNSTADPSGNGEGQTYLGSVTLTTDSGGEANINTLLTASVPVGSFISATATNYYTIIIFPVRGSTSEFSPNLVATPNVAPVNTLPGVQTVNEDTPLAIGGISVIDTNNNLASTELTVNNGTLNVTLTGGAAISAGSNGSASLTLTGTQAAINATLATVTYQGALNFNGADSLRVVSVDTASVPLTDTDTVAITVASINDVPSSTGGAVSGSEDTPYVFAWANFNVSDVDTAIASGTGVRLDILPADGTLEYFNGSGWTPVALGQVVTKATIDAGSLRFVPLADESGYDGYAAAGVGNLRQDYARFSFTPVQTNALTIVNSNGAANVLAEGVGLNPATGWTTSGADAGVQNLVAADFLLDNDNALYVNAGATLTQTLAGTFSAARNYSLAFEFGWRNGAAYPTEPEFRVELWAGTTLLGSMDQTSVTGVQGEFVSGVLAMDGSLSGAVEGAALQIRLVGTDLQTNFDNLTLTSYARVGDIGTTAVMAVDIAPVEDAPTATNLGAAETYTEDTALNLINIVASDVDSANVTATLRLTNVAAGSLSTATSGAVTSTYDSPTGVWTASGAIANVNALLAGVTFNPAANFNGSFTIATSVSDGVTAAITGNKAMTGTAVNDAPTATITLPAYSATEQVNLTLSGTGLSVADVDAGSAVVQVSLSIVSGTLSAAQGATGVTIGSIGPTLAFSGNINQINNLLSGNLGSSLTYVINADSPPVSDTLTLQINDLGNTGGAALTAQDTAVINITAVNDAPTATNLSAAETYTENTALNLTNIVVSDVDSANVTVTLTLSNVAAGSLSTATSGAVTSTYVAGTGVWTASGAIANVNTLLAGVTFNPASNFNSNFSIATSVSDGVAAPVTGTKNVAGTAVNDAPTATNLNTAETYTEDTALNLTNIVVSDIDSATVTVILTLSNTSAGSLSTATSGAVTSTYVAGTGVWTASGAIANVNTLLAGVTFNPASNFNSNFSIATSVSDGVAAPVTGVKAITGTPVNDAPTATNLNAAESYIEDTALNLTDIVVSDVDSANVTVTLTLSNAAAGSLSAATAGAVTSSYVAGTGVWTASGGIADVNTLLAGVTFNAASNFNSNFSIATSLSDGIAAPVTGVQDDYRHTGQRRTDCHQPERSRELHRRHGAKSDQHRCERPG